MIRVNMLLFFCLFVFVFLRLCYCKVSHIPEAVKVVCVSIDHCK